MNPDARRGLGGFLVLLVAIVAISAAEAARFQERPVAWRLLETTLPPQQGELAAAEEGTHAFHVAGPNVAAVRAVLTWTDDIGQPDSFSLTLEGPQSQNAGAGPADGGELTAAADVSTPPGRLLAPSDTAARHMAGLLADAATGVGEWRVHVALDAAPGGALPVGGPVEPQPDGANTYEIALVVTTYAPQE